MRKNILAMSIAAMIGGLGLAGGAQAASLAGAAVTTDATVLELNGKGVGHQLIVPYYTVQNGNATLINLINHDTTNGKVLKVRFRGAANSDDVFDFTLFLSPGDMWAGKISQGADGKARLSTPDASCTLPASVRTNGDAGSPFVTARLDPSASDADKAKGTREGYVEIFNMADIDPTKAYLTGAALNSAVYTATKHVNGVAPCTAAAFSPLADHANIDTTAEVEALGFRAPTTGLSGTWTIIDIAGSTTFSGNATAIEARDVAGGVPATGRIVLFSQTAAGVTTADADTWTSDPLLRTGTVANPVYVAAAQYDFPDLSTPYTGTAAAPATTDPLGQAYLLTSALAVTSVQNEYYTNSIINGATDWVFSMPTRRYNVALDYNVTSATTPTRLYSDYTLSTNPAGGLNFFNSGNTLVSGRQICVKGITVGYADREEGSPVVTDEFVVSPGTPGEPLTFCGEASVLSFNAASSDSVLSASVARKDLSLGSYNQGWANLGTTSPAGGLPILGASFQKYVNPAVSAGVLGNYGVAYPHKTQ
jgi:hypothetical protein